MHDIEDIMYYVPPRFLRMYNIMLKKPNDVVQHTVVQLSPMMTPIKHMNEVKSDEMQN